jgi:hypothetical protein
VCALSTMGCGVGVAYWLDVVYAGFVDISCWSGGGCCVERLGEVWGSARDITYVVLFAVVGARVSQRRESRCLLCAVHVHDGACDRTQWLQQSDGNLVRAKRYMKWHG